MQEGRLQNSLGFFTMFKTLLFARYRPIFFFCLTCFFLAGDAQRVKAFSENSDDPSLTEEPVIVPPALPAFKLQKRGRTLKKNSPSSPFGQNTSNPSLQDPFDPSPVQEKESDDQNVKVTFHKGFHLNVTFTTPPRTKAALYQRDDVLWLFFDAPLPFAPHPYSLMADPSFFLNVEKIPHEEALILKFKIPKRVFSLLSQDSKGWHLTFQKGTPTPRFFLELPVTITTTPSPEISFHVPQQGKILSFQDPETGEKYKVIPVQKGGVLERSMFSGFTILPSLHGVMIQVMQDGVHVTQSPSSFAIHGPEGLSFSRETDQLAHNRSKEVLAPSFLQTMSAPKGKSSSFYETHQAFSHKISSARNTVEKAYKRVAYALYLMHEEMPQEALGQLKLFFEENAPVDEHNLSYPQASDLRRLWTQAMALRGIAQGLSRRHEEAQETFRKGGLSDEPEIRLWQGVFEIEQGQLYEGLTHVLQGLKYVDDYPPFLSRYIYEKTTEANLLLKNSDYFFLNLFVNHASLKAKRSGLVTLFKTLQKKNENLLDEAIPAFETLKKAHSPYVRVWAAYELSKLRTDQKSLTDHITLLEKNRFWWRRHPLELKLLKHLSALYGRDKNPSQQLRLLRQIIVYYPETLDAYAIQNQTERIVYETLCGSQSLQGIKALAFYKEFQDLEPHDNRHTQIQKKLLDTYLDLNLLYEARQILQALLKNGQEKMPPEEKIHLLFKLADIQWGEKKLSKSLETLKEIERSGPLPQPLLLQKVSLEARILTEMKEYNHALQVLESMSQPPTLALLQQKADIAFSAKNWGKAIQYMEDIRHYKESHQELTPDVILNLAVAYYHGHRKKELENLIEKYRTFMVKSPLAVPFSILAAPPSAPQPTPEDLAQALEAGKKFDALMNQYRRTLKEK